MPKFTKKLRIPKAIKSAFDKGLKRSINKEMKPQYDASQPLRQNIPNTITDRYINQELSIFVARVNSIFSVAYQKELRDDNGYLILCEMRGLCVGKTDGEILEMLNTPYFDKYFISVDIQDTKSAIDQKLDDILKEDENIVEDQYDDIVFSQDSSNLYKEWKDRKIKEQIEAVPVIKDQETLNMIDKYKETLNSDQESIDFNYNKLNELLQKSNELSRSANKVQEEHIKMPDKVDINENTVTEITDSKEVEELSVIEPTVVEVLFKPLKSMELNTIDNIVDHKNTPEIQMSATTYSIKIGTRKPTLRNRPSVFTLFFGALSNIIWGLIKCIFCIRERTKVYKMNDRCRNNILKALINMQSRITTSELNLLDDKYCALIKLFFTKDLSGYFNDVRLSILFHNVIVILKYELNGLFDASNIVDVYQMIEKVDDPELDVNIQNTLKNTIKNMELFRKKVLLQLIVFIEASDLNSSFCSDKINHIIDIIMYKVIFVNLVDENILYSSGLDIWDDRIKKPIHLEKKTLRKIIDMLIGNTNKYFN